jgi:hypothetical protein
MNVLSDGKGSYGFKVVDKLLGLTFPGIKITHNDSVAPDLVVRSHFDYEETFHFSCPYITWSGEPYKVKMYKNLEPLCQINTFLCEDENSVYFPLLVQDSQIKRHARQFIKDKKYCCAYAFSNPVKYREELFKSMRKREKTCFSFGKSCYTSDNPFVLPRSNRFDNSKKFNEFGFIVALENTQKWGYFTEKIGLAFESGGVPIYNSTNGIERFINLDSFFDVATFSTPESAAEAAINVWRDKQKLQKYLDAPIRINKNLQEYENLLHGDEETTCVNWIPFVKSLREHFPDL